MWYYLNETTIAESLGTSGKPYMVSISGKTLDDNLLMIKRVIEVNKEDRKNLLPRTQPCMSEHYRQAHYCV